MNICSFQIKVCYDKKFQRVDCDGIKGLKVGHMMGSCLKDKSFFYPNTTDPISSPSDAGMIAGVICTILALTRGWLWTWVWIVQKSKNKRKRL